VKVFCSANTKDQQVGNLFLADALLNLISSQRGGDYNGKIDCKTPALYGGRYITGHPDNRLTSRCPCASLPGIM